ncbi:D-alanyl-D-alanine carboxypeptidase family protein [Luteolibacter sp. AS25]|uniref:D-alanyl-D-alanine carboxypeptidase family protein n=1 Tax=Luteolibacter sp. AS25 TaxID=3135776 RepID=UPI00398AC479
MQKILILLLAMTLSLTAQEAHMVVEAYSGKVLSAQNSTEKRPVASLTKITTAVVAIDWVNASGADFATHLVKVPEIVTQVPTPSSINLAPGDILTLRDALYAAMLTSDNKAALTVAHHVGIQLLKQRGRNGDPIEAFVTEMNHFAKAVNAKQTLFRGPHGLPINEKVGYSTAADVAKISIHAMRRNALNFMVQQKTREISIDSSAGTRKYTLRNTNELLGEPGVIGIKTGTTNFSGPCLATCMERDPLVRTKQDGTKGVTPRRLIVVVLNSPDRFGKTRKLIRDGWKFYDAWLAQGAPVNNQKREILDTPRS